MEIQAGIQTTLDLFFAKHRSIMEESELRQVLPVFRTHTEHKIIIQYAFEGKTD
jgi:hypothetical protein